MASRHWSVCLLWLALAMLPLRGWANATMHLPTSGSPLAAASASLPCHAQASSSDAAGEPGKTCALCDLCHATALPAGTAPLARSTFSPPQVATQPELALGGGPSVFFRPPRG